MVGKLVFCSVVFCLLWTNNSFAQWGQLGMDIDGEAAYDFSGRSVDMSSDGIRIAIGASENSGSSSVSGHVRVYEWNGIAWIQLGSDIDGESSGDFSGTSVSMSDDGSRVAIGAPGNGGNGSLSGNVRIFEWDGTTWNQLGNSIEGAVSGDHSGAVVNISGDGARVAISSPFNDNGGNNAGHVRVYEWSTGSWVQLGTSIDGEYAGDSFGNGICLNGDGSRLIVGAPFNNAGGINNGGYARIFEWNSTSWVQIGNNIVGTFAGDNTGTSVSITPDGTRIAVGAIGANGGGLNRGSATIYDWTGTNWVQLGAHIFGEASGDFSARSVRLSDDGTRIAIGTHLNDGSGADAGQVRVYEWQGGTGMWLQLGMDVDGEAIEDEFGYSVGMSSDGYSFVAGGAKNDDNGDLAGNTRVYKYVCHNTVDVVSACGPYTWVDGTTYTSSNNTATITLQNVAGCDSIVTLDLTMNSVNTLTSTMDFTITADAQNATYQWIDCDNNTPISGETSQSFTATSNGNYAVIVTENGCSDTSACATFTTIGLKETTFNSSYSLYPNPSNGEVQITFNEVQEDLSISVLDMHGRILSEYCLTNVSEAEIQLGAANGMYLVRIASKDQLITERVYKQ